MQSMNRRQLLGALAATAAGLVANEAIAGITCGPYGPNGVQVCSAGVDFDSASAFAALQENSQWCWAACIQMVFRHYGYAVSQSEIVSQAWGAPVNMPGQPQQILDSLNRLWVDDRGRKFRASATSFGVSPQTAALDLAQDRPLIIGTIGHAVVLTAVSYLRDVAGNGAIVDAIVRDPWPGRGRRSLTPQEWMAVSFVARIVVEGMDEETEPQPRCHDVVHTCEHAAHPAGDASPCMHPAHAYGDAVPCQHVCASPYGPVPCHQADAIPCSHPAHPQGDVSPCVHPRHPEGDIERVCE